jgi:plastocyanin
MKSALIICMLVAVLLLGCASYSSNTPTQQPSGGGQTPPGTHEVTVNITGFKFQPASIQVAAGTKVTWVNDDSVSHTVTADNGAFDTGQFPHGDSRSYTFNTKGVFTYHCSIHPSMTGSVTVT